MFKDKESSELPLPVKNRMIVFLSWLSSDTSILIGSEPTCTEGSVRERLNIRTCIEYSGILLYSPSLITS